MTQDPRYAPPTTPVADLVPARAPRPRQVRIAVGLLWLSLALSIPEVMLSTVWPQGGGFSPFVAMALVIFALAAFLTFKIYQGHNWARITLLMLTALSIYLVMFPSQEGPVEGPLVQGLSLFDVLLDVVATYLVFTPPGAGWFRR